MRPSEARELLTVEGGLLGSTVRRACDQPLLFLTIILGLPVHDLQYGPQAAFISESFPGTLRYSGASLGYQLASITAGGPAPLVAVYLFRTFQTSMAVATYVSVCAVISLICVWYL